jgi:integrase
VIIVLWRAGLRISEALALNETDLDSDRGALLIRHGRGDKRREVGMDHSATGRPAHDVRAGGHPRTAAPRRRGGRGPSPVRAASTAPRARR